MKIHMLVPKVHKSLADQSENQTMFIDAAQRLGHEIQLIEAKNCRMTFVKKPKVVINGIDEKVKALIVRTGFVTNYSETFVSLVRQFELQGTRVFNGYEPIMLARNKIRSHQVMSQKGIPAPITFAVKSSEHIESMMDVIKKFPVIIKKATGSLGVGVSIVESKRALRSIVDMMAETDGDEVPILVQEFVRESKGKDIRVMVVGGRIVAAMERIAVRKGEFRSNFSIGGKVKVTELSNEEKKLAIKTAKVFNLEWAGIDIIRSSTGPKILEVNSNPHVKGITQATGVDVAGAIIKYIVKKVEKGKKNK